MNSLQTAQRIRNLELSAIRRITEAAPAGAVNLGLGEIRFPPPACLIEKAKKILAEDLLGYTPNAGIIELRKSICSYYQIDFTDNVCVTNGAEEAIFAVMFSYLEPGDEVILADPTFPAYRTIAEMLSAKVVTFEQPAATAFRMDRDSFRRAFTSKTKLVFLNNPANPMGTCFNQEEMALIGQICCDRKVLLVADEVYRELFIAERPASFIDCQAETLCLSSLSKSHCLSGWRIGWVVSRIRSLIEPVIKVHQYLATCAPALAQKVAVEALAAAGMEASESIRQQLLINREIAFQYLKNINLLPNKSLPYLFAQVEEDDFQVARKLAEEGVIVIPGSAFGANAAGWIRINCGVEKDIFIRGMEILRDYLET